MHEIQTKNVKDEVEDVAYEFVNRLVEKDEDDRIVGVLFDGGMGERNWIDEHSDFDLSVWVEGDPPSFLPRFEFEFVDGDDRYLFHVEQCDIDEERQKRWSAQTKEAYDHGTIVYEKDDALSELFDQKLEWDDEMALERMIRIAGNIPWLAETHSLTALRRGFDETAHYVLNRAVDEVLEFLYLLNREYLTHPKWRISGLRYLDHIEADELPHDFDELIRQALLVTEFDETAVRNRIEAIMTLHERMLSLARQEYPDFPDDPWQATNERNIRDKRLLDQPFSKTFVEKYDLDDEDARRVEGVLNYHVVHDEERAKELVERFCDVSLN